VFTTQNIEQLLDNELWVMEVIVLFLFFCSKVAFSALSRLQAVEGRSGKFCKRIPLQISWLIQ